MIFKFNDAISIRVIKQDGMPLFVAGDVCRALGITNVSDALNALDDDEKGIANADTLGGKQGVLVVTESGLYWLIFKSRKPEAAAFRKWVTAEVLPSLRRTGRYMMPGHVQTGDDIFDGQSPDDVRLANAVIRTASRFMPRPAVAWLWEHYKMPVPPRHLLPRWWQSDLFRPDDQRGR